MILILSQDGLEPTTDEVAEWIGALGGDCVRLNAGDLGGAVPLSLEVDAGGARMRVSVGGREVDTAEVGAVWLRRWQGRQAPALRAPAGAEDLARRVGEHLAGETNAVTRAFFALLAHARWLTRPEETMVNKLDALRAAAAAGLEVPATLVATRADEIERFRLRHGRVVTKSVGEMASFPAAGKLWGLFTAEVDADAAAALPEQVFPSLVQERLEKAFEVRAFCLAGRVWAMAIFSQAQERTSLDFRQYNRRRPSRTVPYLLPNDVQGAVVRFMESMRLSTGSVDLVRTPEGRHVFLEVNPAGQFGMVSKPCNFYLERRVAEHLLAEDAHGGA